MFQHQTLARAIGTVVAFASMTGISLAQRPNQNNCAALPNHGTLKAALYQDFAVARSETL